MECILIDTCRRFTLENLTWGWRKYIKQYHYHEAKELHALCGNATYTPNEFKELEFLTDIEIRKTMVTCKECRSLRREYMRYVIKNEVPIGRWINTKCPKCKTDVMFWDGKKKDQHLCTVCLELVTV